MTLSVLALLTAATLVPVWNVGVLPLQDLPNHLLKVDLLRRYLAGDVSTRSLYALNLTPFSNWTCYVILGALAQLCPLQTAAKVFVSLYLMALPATAYVWLRRIHPSNAALALATPILGHNLFLSKGNLNFCLALALYLACLACFETRGRRTGAAFSILATILYFTHGVVFLALAGVIVLRLLLPFDLRLAPRAFGLVPGLLCMGATILIPGGEALSLQWRAPELYLVGDATLWLFASKEALLPALLWSVVMAGCIALSIFGWIASGSRRWIVRRGLWLLVALLLGLAYLLAPADLADWSHLQERFIPLAILTALGGARLPRSASLRIAAVAMLAFATAWSLRITMNNYRDGEADLVAYAAALDRLEPDAAILPLYFGDATQQTRPTLHAWAYHIQRRGGWAPYLQHAQHLRTARLLYPIVYRTAPWTPRETNAEVNSPLAQRAAGCYDYVVMWGAKAPDMEPMRPYFDLVVDQGPTQVWRNRSGIRRATPKSSSACRADS
ncbi:MAG: hypothetical protein HY270_16125 [Deltaproteobacteria bacterium]|nr:hypothetical protein [Deltaproteobacteria bacterium]